MTDKKPTDLQIEALEAQIKHDQEKPVRENERRVRIGENLENAVAKMSKTLPINNKDLVKWSKSQRDAGIE